MERVVREGERGTTSCNTSRSGEISVHTRAAAAGAAAAAVAGTGGESREEGPGGDGDLGRAGRMARRDRTLGDRLEVSVPAHWRSVPAGDEAPAMDSPAADPRPVGRYLLLIPESRARRAAEGTFRARFL